MLRDPVSRKEVATGRRLSMIIMSLGVCIPLGLFIYCNVEVLTGRDDGTLALTIPPYSFFVLCALAVTLGGHSITREVSEGTAEALILTSAPRKRLVRAKICGALRPLAFPALILTSLYILAAPSMRSPTALVDVLYGGLLRVEATDRLFRLPDAADASPLLDVCVALGALGSDMSWYVFCAALGVYLSTVYCGAPLRSIAGFAVVFLLLMGAALVEGHVSDIALVERVHAEGPNISRAWRGSLSGFPVYRRGFTLFVYSLPGWALCAAGKWVGAYLLLHKTAKRLDAIVVE